MTPPPTQPLASQDETGTATSTLRSSVKRSRDKSYKSVTLGSILFRCEPDGSISSAEMDVESSSSSTHSRSVPNFVALLRAQAGISMDIPIHEPLVDSHPRLETYTSSLMGRVVSSPSLAALANPDDEAHDDLIENSPVVKSKKARIQRSISAPALESLDSLVTVGPASASMLSFREDRPFDTLINTSPVDYLVGLVQAHGVSAKFHSALAMNDFFQPTTLEGISGYGVEIITAVRQEDIEALKEIQDSGATLQCSNRFGESIVHMACRRGSINVLQFLLDAGVSIRLCDDYGRTPLHDACWTREPQFELVATLIRECPDLLLVSDKRGFTPLSYVRRDHWGDWCRFLEEHREFLVPRELR